jgi:hypothetical protein
MLAPHRGAIIQNADSGLIVEGYPALNPTFWPPQNRGPPRPAAARLLTQATRNRRASSRAHCNRRGAAPRAPIAAKIGALDGPENCPHFYARLARVRALWASPRMARPCRCARGALQKPPCASPQPSPLRATPSPSLGPASTPPTPRRRSPPSAGLPCIARSWLPVLAGFWLPPPRAATAGAAPPRGARRGDAGQSSEPQSYLMLGLNVM